MIETSPGRWLELWHWLSCLLIHCYSWSVGPWSRQIFLFQISKPPWPWWVDRSYWWTSKFTEEMLSIPRHCGLILISTRTWGFFRGELSGWIDCLGSETVLATFLTNDRLSLVCSRSWDRFVSGWMLFQEDLIIGLSGNTEWECICVGVLVKCRFDLIRVRRRAESYIHQIRIRYFSFLKTREEEETLLPAAKLYLDPHPKLVALLEMVVLELYATFWFLYSQIPDYRLNSWAQFQEHFWSMSLSINTMKMWTKYTVSLWEREMGTYRSFLPLGNLLALEKEYNYLDGLLLWGF